ncbi:hypothetical protein BGX24_008187, partial [Mortierella sp. AD032]
SMALRSGKAVAKEGTLETSGATVVETAMESMSIAAESSSDSGSVDMEVDDESRVAPVVNPPVATIEDIRAQIRELGAKLSDLTNSQTG